MNISMMLDSLEVFNNNDGKYMSVISKIVIW